MKDRVPFLMLAVSSLLAGTVAGQPAGRSAATSGEAVPPSQSPKDQSSGTVILNETTYSRQYVQFGVDRVSPAQLKSPETAKLLSCKLGRGLSAMDSLKNEVKTVLGFMGRKWDADLEEGGWMDEAYVLYRQCQAWVLGSHGSVNVQAARVPPPADRMAPEFEDLGWPHLQGSLVVGAPGAGSRDDVQELGRRAIFVRYRFEVPEPAKADGLTLKLVYRGGARVFLNGKELARGHLPQGEITPETRGEDYPMEAYVPLNEDGTMVTYEAHGVKSYPFFVADLYGKFDNAPLADRKYPGMRMGRLKDAGRWCDCKNWDRLQALRDRVIGPVALPASQLRKGANVLAVEIRASDLHPIAAGFSVWKGIFDNSNYHHGAWFHGQIVNLELAAKGSGVPSMRVRRPGVQVWVEDIHHRVISSEFPETGDATGTLRFVTTVNGEFSGQLIVGTDKDLTGLKAAATDLQLAGGAGTIPASALTIAYMVPHALPELAPLKYSGSETSRGGATWKIKPTEARELLARYGPIGLDVEGLKPEEAIKEAGKISFFDHTGAAPPAVVPAGTCQALWVTLKTPANAPAGLYKGSVRVEAEGAKPVTVPVEAEVIGWRMPDTRDWQQVIQIEQSPYGVAEHYKVAPWSEEHFKLMEASFKALGRIGDKWLFVPVLQNTELGNRADSMLKWVRKKDLGAPGLSFDYSVMDRYIDLAAKYWGKPRVICFYVMHGGAEKTTVTVPLLDEATGQTVAYDMSNKSPKYREDWQAFGKAMYAHMKAKGLLDSMYFGYRWDGDGDPGLSVVLSTAAPGVPWASGSHGYAVPPQYTCESRIYGLSYGTGIVKGWKRSNILLLNPRGGGTVIEVTGQSDPALFRILPDRALMAGCNGIARIAADYWESVYFKGCTAWQYLIPGMAINSWMLWPGQNGAEGSQRMEVLKEGVEEAEARIYIEQALDQGSLPPELAKRAVDVLNSHEQENYFIPMSSSQAFIPFFMDWQGRARRLFTVAAQIAALGFDLEKSALSVNVPAFGAKQASWKIRNWVATPIDWKAQTDTPWITLSKTAGKLNGHEDFNVLLDAAQLAPEAKAEGKVAFTAGDRTRTITIAVHVSKVMEYTPADSASPLPYVPDKGHVVFNAPVGAAQSQEFTVFNQAAKELSWKCASDLPWVKVEPAVGKAPPQSGIVIKATAAPPDKQAAFYKGMLTLTDENSPAKISVPLAVHVIPEYQKPNLPQAVRVFPFDANPHIDGNPVLKACRTQGYPQWGASQLGSHDAVFNIEGKKFKAFSAEVSVPKVWATSGFSGETADFFSAVFEVIVDGKIRASSGIMKPQGGLRVQGKGDMEERLLVVDGLEGAKELVLSGRFTTLPGAHQALVWSDPKLYSDARHHVPAAHAADAMVYIDPGSSSPLPYVPDRGSVVFNVPASTAANVELTVFSQSAREISWKCVSDLPWLKVEPSSGKAAPNSDITLKATAAPPDKEAAFLKGTLTLTDENSQAKLSIPVAVHVIPEYQKPNPPQAAKAVAFDGKSMLKAHHNVHSQTTLAWDGFEMGSHTAVFNIEGKKFKAFSAEVSVPKVWGGGGYNGTTEDNCQAVFEILVDGKVRASSGVMKPLGGGRAEMEKRLLVVEGISGAKELILTARFLALPDKYQGLYWDEQKVYPE